MIKDNLLEVQKELGAIKKDKNNPFFKSKYADINSLLQVLKPVLNKHGITVQQPLKVVEGAQTLETTINGETVSSMLIPEVADPQKLGAVITYYRRYALQSLFLMEAEDDDANSVSGTNAVKPTLKRNTEAYKGISQGSQTMIGTCEKCGNEFQKDQIWKTTCLDCYKKGKFPSKEDLEPVKDVRPSDDLNIPF